MTPTTFFGPGAYGATFSPCRLWRYSLWRRWSDCAPDHMVAFIGLNPSTADEVRNDPTVRRCINFAKAWGFGGMVMLNAFAYRATDPRDMKRQEDPVGPWNDVAILEIARSVPRVVCCWGAHGAWHGRHGELVRMLQFRELRHMGLTKAGRPRHPLYLANATEPNVWELAGVS